MDDNELDKLFGEDSKSDDEALEENKAKKTGQSKEPDKSEPSGDAEDNPFVLDKDKKDPEDKEDGESDDEPDDSDETPDEEKEESEASEGSGEDEDSEGSDEDQEGSDEEGEDESEPEDESSDEKSAQSSPERRRRERVKPEKIRSESSIHISGKAIAAILLVIAVTEGCLLGLLQIPIIIFIVETIAEQIHGNTTGTRDSRDISGRCLNVFVIIFKIKWSKSCQHSR